MQKNFSFYSAEERGALPAETKCVTLDSDKPKELLVAKIYKGTNNNLNSPECCVDFIDIDMNSPSPLFSYKSFSTYYDYNDPRYIRYTSNTFGNTEAIVNPKIFTRDFLDKYSSLIDFGKGDKNNDEKDVYILSVLNLSCKIGGDELKKFIDSLSDDDTTYLILSDTFSAFADKI